MREPRRTRPRITAAERQFENWLTRQDTIRLLCRINGHWWPGYRLDGHSRVGRVPEAYQRLGSYQMTMACEREIDGQQTGCGVTCRAYFNGDYTPSVRTYTYPPGYMLPEGVYFNKGRRGRARLELDIRAEEG